MFDNLVTHRGGCHCGKVRFEVDAEPSIDAILCNCSICALTAHLHLHVLKKNFRLLTDWDQISTYSFNTGVARHYFCKSGGIKSFYIPRSNPHGYSVNVRCLQPDTIEGLRVTEFDGQNWEENVHKINKLPEEDA